MPDLSELISHWGYAAIFVVVVSGNLGIPVPEEAILVVAGYLVWEGQLQLPIVFVVGIVSAVVGDNLGYWVGKHYGRRAIERYGQRFYITPERVDSAQRFVIRYGPIGVLIARFVPGLRFMAGPLAGTAGMPFPHFLVSNILGAAIYVPLVVAVGYAIGLGLGDYIVQFELVGGKVEHIVFVAVLVSAVVLLGWRVLRTRRSSSRPE